MPLVILIGFLGAGKTTFIRDLLEPLRERGLKPHVMINDYLNARVDASRIRELTDEVEAINGNCVCCDSLQTVVSGLLGISPAPDRVILVEANGTSDPFPLIEAFTALSELRERFDPLLQVTIVDAKRWQNRAHGNDLEFSQATPASHLWITRREEVRPDRLEEVEEALSWINPKARRLESIEQFADELLDVTGQSEPPAPPHQESLAGIEPGAVISQGDFRISAPSFPATGADAGILTSPGRQAHQASHAYVAMQLDLPEAVEKITVLEWAEKLPPSVLRLKGLVRLADMPEMFFVIQRTDDGSTPTFLPLFTEPTMEPCAVLIGVHLDPETIQQLTVDLLGT
jgi:G3E family GTPase